LKHTQNLLFATRFTPRHYLSLLLIAAAIWCNGRVMAELASDVAISSPPEATTWPMLPGESLNQLAALFYPGNKPMQRRFVAKTLELSHEINPALDPASVFAQPGTLIIPELKTMSRQAPPFKAHRSKSGKATPVLHLSYQLKDAAKFAATPEMDAAYESLSRRNMALQDELQRLNQRFAALQTSMQQMQATATTLMNQTVRSLAPISVQPASPVTVPVAPPSTPALSPPLAKDKLAATMPIWNNILVQFLVLLAGLILALYAWFWVRKRLARKLEDATNEQIAAMRKNAFSPNNNPLFVATDSGALNNADSGMLSVEEIESVVEEARIFVSMDRANEAITLLLSYIETQPKGSVQPWVYLLDIYRNQNKKDEYIELAKRFHHTFNVMRPQWEETKVAMVVATSLEEFPHIIPHLVAAWTAGEAMQYLEDLLEDNRDGERAGFALEVMQEIMLLQGILEIRDEMPDKAQDVRLALS
jgi:HAMP domain-containing protein